MAFDKIVDSQQLDKDINSVADAIRKKTGRDEEMTWPEDFNKNINSITGNGAQPDWNVNDEYSPAYIRNKPNVATKEELQGIVDGAPEAFDTLKEVSDWIEKNNKQVDWNQNDETAVDFIKNKPTIPRPDWNQNDNTKIDYIKNRPFYEGLIEFKVLNNELKNFEDEYGPYNTKNTIFNYVIPEEEQEIYDNFFKSHKRKCSFIIDNESHEYIFEQENTKEISFPTTTIPTASNIFINFSPNSINFKANISSEESSTSHQLSLFLSYEKIVPIDSKFLTNKPGSLSTGKHSEIFNNLKSNEASGDYSHAEGDSSSAIGDYSHAEGSTTKAMGESSHAEGARTKAYGGCAHAEGYETEAYGNSAHAEGYFTNAIGTFSHSEGGSSNNSFDYYTKRTIIKTVNIISYKENSKDGSVIIKCTPRINEDDLNTKKLSYVSIKERDYGSQTTFKFIRIDDNENDNTSTIYANMIIFESTYYDSNRPYYILTFSKNLFARALGDYSHVEGHESSAVGNASHAEGEDTTAYGYNSHAEGQSTTTYGFNSHAEGYGTIANSDNSHVEGTYNLLDTEDGTENTASKNTYAHVVGNGTFGQRSNAHTLDWDGNAWYAGTVEGTAMIVKSSTPDSTKRFKITVDDSGTIKAEEILTTTP